jgi:hypothetical protein
MKRGLILLVSGTLLAFVVSSHAFAGQFHTSTDRFQMVWISMSFESFFTTVRCPVTLDGSFSARTFAKRQDQTIGQMYHTALNGRACTGGSATLELLAANALVYRSFTGTLPRITGVITGVLGWRIRAVTTEGFEVCTATTTLRNQAGLTLEVNEGTGVVTGARLDESRAIACDRPVGATVRVSGRGSFKDGSGRNDVTVTLI